MCYLVRMSHIHCVRERPLLPFLVPIILFYNTYNIMRNGSTVCRIVFCFAFIRLKGIFHVDVLEDQIVGLPFNEKYSIGFVIKCSTMWFIVKADELLVYEKCMKIFTLFPMGKYPVLSDKCQRLPNLVCGSQL